MSKKVALIIGIVSQDGHYLSKILIDKGYEVHGTTRRVVSDINGVKLHYLDLNSSVNLLYLLEDIKPDEIYNFAAISSVSESFKNAKLVSEINGIFVLSLLDGISKTKSDCKVYQSSTSELFGFPEQSPQTEQTKFHPVSPYAISKLYAHSTVVFYREAYGIHASNGILYNHCSPMRPNSFVEKKISMGVAEIKLGLKEKLSMGNIYSCRDWGYSPDFCEAIWRIVQQEKSDDYIVSTEETHSIKEFVELSFKCAGIGIRWEGVGIDEVARGNDGTILVDINPEFYRPIDIGKMCGDCSKIKKIGWEPKVKFNELVEIMYKSDYDLISNKLV